MKIKRYKSWGLLSFFAVFIFLLLPAASTEATISQQDSNGKIVFTSTRSVGNDIYTMNADGSNVTRLTTDTLSYWPMWSPDGTKIVYSSSQSGAFDIYTMNADGSSKTRLTTATGDDTIAYWSPDGTKITFTSGRDGNAELYVMNADGSSQTRLTNNAGSDFYPAWSPDGTKIVFATDRDSNYEIYTMSPDGSNLQRITNSAGNDYVPSWSPDGTKIIFTSFRDGNNEIYVMNANGTSQVNLTNNAAYDYLPTWSRDGTKIAFASNRTGNLELFTINADGSSPTNITNNADSDYTPSMFAVLTPVCTTSGTRNCIVSAANNLSSTNFTISNNEVLQADGIVGNITIESGGNLKGTGTAGTVTVQSGGHVAPGTSPGCLSSGNTSFASGSGFDVEIVGTTVCTEYDQLQVTGTVSLGSATLSTSLLSSYVPPVGTTFIIINNDSTDAVTGTFSGLAEGATFTAGGVLLQISYIGGTGNDITITVRQATASTESTPTAPSTGVALLKAHPVGSFLVSVLSAGTLFGLSYRFKGALTGKK